MTKIITGAIMGIVVFGTAIATTTSRVTLYCEREKVHEQKQEERFARQEEKIAKVSLKVIKMRMRDIEQAMRRLEREAGCPNCTGFAKEAWDAYKREYKELQDQAKQVTGG